MTRLSDLRRALKGALRAHLANPSPETADALEGAKRALVDHQAAAARHLPEVVAMQDRVNRLGRTRGG